MNTRTTQQGADIHTVKIAKRVPGEGRIYPWWDDAVRDANNAAKLTGRRRRVEHVKYIVFHLLADGPMSTIVGWKVTEPKPRELTP